MCSIAKNVQYKHYFDLNKSQLCIEFVFTSADGVNNSAGCDSKYEIIIKGDDVKHENFNNKPNPKKESVD